MIRKKRGDKTEMDIRPTRPVRPMSRNGVGPSSQRRVHASAAVTPSAKPQPKMISPQQSFQPTPSRKSKKERERSRLWLRIVRGVVVSLALITVLGWFVYSEVKNSSTAIDTTKYQAVFLTNGQVYFGKLKPFTNKSMKLTDVYYLQEKASTKKNIESSESSNPQQSSSAQNNVELIKLGDELHGPEDEMVILLEQLQFYENLKTDSKVVQSIERHKQSQ